MTMAMSVAGKQKKIILARTKAQGRLLLFWVGCVCPMGVYMNLWTLYVSKLVKYHLICPGDLVGDPKLEDAEGMVFKKRALAALFSGPIEHGKVRQSRHSPK
jgi:hypothetical protein